MADRIQQFSATNSISSAQFVSVTVPQEVPAGRKLIVSVGVNHTPASVVVSDSRGNTYTQDASASVTANNNSTYIFSCDVTTVVQAGDSITATFPVNESRKLIHVQEWSGLGALDRIGSTTGSGAAMDVALSAATSQASEVVFGAFIANLGANVTSDFTADSPWVEGDEVEILTGSTGRGLYSGYQIVSSTSTYSFGGDVNVTPAGNWAGAIASYLTEAGATSFALTLGTFLDPVNDVAFGVFMRDVNAAVDPDSGFFELADFGMASPPFRLAVEQRTGQDLSVAASDTGGDDGSAWIGIASEFRAATASADKAITPSGIVSTSTVTATVFKGDIKTVALRGSSGPFIFLFRKPMSIISRSVVTGTVERTTGGSADKAIVPNVLGIQSMTSVSAAVNLGNTTVIPAQINSRSTITATVTGPLPLIDFTPETRAAPALTIPFTVNEGVLIGDFKFRRLRED